MEATSVFLAEARLIHARLGRREQKLKGVVFFFFGAHGEKCRSDDHSEKYQCKNKIVDHWGVSLMGGSGRLGVIIGWVTERGHPPSGCRSTTKVVGNGVSVMGRGLVG